MTIACRPADLANPSERNFIVNGWCDSYKDADMAGLIQIEDWFAVMIPQVVKAMNRPGVRTMIAIDSDDADQFYGFITADTLEQPPLVYYVYVKSYYRRGGRGRLWDGPGAARQLFAAIGVDPGAPFRYVCSTAILKVLARKIPMARWQPLLGRFPKEERRKR